MDFVCILVTDNFDTTGRHVKRTASVFRSCYRARIPRHIVAPIIIDLVPAGSGGIEDIVGVLGCSRAGEDRVYRVGRPRSGVFHILGELIRCIEERPDRTGRRYAQGSRAMMAIVFSQS